LLFVALIQIYEFAAERRFPQYSLLKNSWVTKIVAKHPSVSPIIPQSPEAIQHVEADQKDHPDSIESRSAPPSRTQHKEPVKAKAEAKPKPLPRPKESERLVTGRYFSNNLLSLWTPQELEGSPGDKHIQKVSPPDIRPPQQREPRVRLPLLAEGRHNSIRRVRIASGDKPVALTFDLCEQADDKTGYDRDIVNTLRAESIRATFFAGGKWMRNHVDKTQQLMADPNFELGNHGWTHGNLRVMKGQRMVEQITWTQAEYERIYGLLEDKAEKHGLGDQFSQVSPFMKTLRFPYGTCNGESLDVVNELGLSAIQWDVVSADAAKGQTAGAMTKKVVSQVQPGSIVVFHANGRGSGTSQALPEIIAELRHKGYRFVTVSDLLELGDPVTSAECYEMKPGDNKKYDAMFGEGTGAN
jgi:peptidoglycan/xylan/chitin deacetylase (PgdA/CDA1 family)